MPSKNSYQLSQTLSLANSPGQVWPSAPTVLPMREKSSASEFRIIDPREFPEWDALMRQGAGSTLFHTRAWADVLCESYSYKPVYLVRMEGGDLRSALPLIEVSSWATGNRGISLPFTDECGPVAAPSIDAVANEAEGLLNAALSLGRERGWSYTEIRSAHGGFRDLPASASFYGHSVDLRLSGEELFARFDSSVRRAIRKGERENITMSISTERADMDAFFELHCRTRRRHGVPPQPRRFFAMIFRHIIARGNGFLCLAKVGSHVLAAAVFFHFRKHAVYKFGASDYRQQECRANNVLFWKAIQHLKSIGCTELDLGRTSMSNTGLRRFKSGWGSAERIMHYIRVDNRTNGALFSRDKSEGPLNAFFRRLPVCLNKAVGRFVYPHIA
jgi:CelD/BcsL family acetyltransferase involved in cellulose biosynthesis